MPNRAEASGEKRHLSVGDRIQGYPCVVTILHVGESSAYGRCSTCRERHIIDPPMADRWVPTLGYSLARVDGNVLVMKHGGVHVKPSIPDDEVMLRPIATAVDYDEGVRIIQALRAAHSGSSRGSDV